MYQISVHVCTNFVYKIGTFFAPNKHHATEDEVRGSDAQKNKTTFWLPYRFFFLYANTIADTTIQ